MLAAWGFIITSVVLALFAWTFSAASRKVKVHLPLFVYTYYLLAVAFLMWGIAAWNGNAKFLQFTIFFGDVVLLAGTACLLATILSRNTLKEIAPSVAVISAAGLAIRAVYLPPIAYIQNGIIVFNIQRPVLWVITVVIACLWLPAHLLIMKSFMQRAKLASLVGPVVGIYAVICLSVLGFLSAHQRGVIIGAFTVMAVCFFGLLMLNNYIINQYKPGKKHAE